MGRSRYRRSGAHTYERVHISGRLEIRRVLARARDAEDAGAGADDAEGEEDGGEEDEEAAYFRVAGPLVSPGVHVAAVDSDDD